MGNDMIQEDKEQECKKCGRVFGSVRCFDLDCPNNTPKNNYDTRRIKKISKRTSKNRII